MRKVKEKSDKYYIEKYNLTPEQLDELKAKRNAVDDPDLIIEDFIESEPVFSLSIEAKINYLNTLKSKIVRILYLIEQSENNPNISPSGFIKAILFDINTANDLFNGTLAEIYVKIMGVFNLLNGEEEAEFATIRKQVLEARSNVDYLINGLKK